MNNLNDNYPALWKHQEHAIKNAGTKNALFFDPGCGKTRTAIELFKKSCVKNAIIFAPISVCKNWADELLKFCSEYEFEIFIIAGQTKNKKLTIFQNFAESKSRYKFLICNTETVRSSEYTELIIDTKCNFFIVDESHQFKTHNSKQTQGLIRILDRIKPMYVYLLTGTPAPKGEIDLWSTFYLLGQTTDSFWIWRRKHFVDKNERRRGMRNYWPDYSVLLKSKEYFNELLEACAFRARKNEVLDLPDLLRTTLYTQMSDEQAKHYENMKEYLFAIDEEGNELNASNLLVRTLRLQQILAGFIGITPIKKNPRLETLKEAIEKTQGEQFIIWTIFSETYKQVSNMLNSMAIQHGFITGEQSIDERNKWIDQFQGGTLRCLVCHPKAGGIGINLTAASYSIHYTRSFSLVDDMQAEARNYRGGSERHQRITRIDIITPKTIDEEISKALLAKKTVQDFILDLKREK